ncbi:MAG: hypothetical protein H6Q68_3253 [Firmicutes bacterium]|nr:hypothetical protein [Bacillota bacterium]
MEKLYIESTKSTPEIRFDPVINQMYIKGQSYPENAFKFYEPIFAWVDEYIEQMEQEVLVEIYFHMPYVNTSSSKCLMMLLEKLDEAYQAGKKVMVRWYYDKENEMAMECAEEFKEDLTVPFEINPVEENS